MLGSLSNFYHTGPYREYIEEYRSAGKSPIEMLRVCQPEGDFSDPACDELILQRVDCDNIIGEIEIGDSRSDGVHHLGDFFLVPPNTATTIILNNSHKASMFIFPMKQIKHNLQEHFPDFNGDFGPLHSRSFRNPELIKLTHRLFHEAQSNSPLGNLFAESLGDLIVAELLRHSEKKPKNTRKIKPLNAASIKLIDDYLDSEISSSVTLSDLSSLTQQSTFHFSKAFKAATGQSPHQYQLARKLSRAENLLIHSKQGLAEIAYDCGFSSQSHMTTVFSKFYGVTPGRYRKEKLN